MDNNDTPAIEQNERVIRLLRINWDDSQATCEWDRISFQLHGASLVTDGQLSNELDFLSSIAWHRGAMLKPDYNEVLRVDKEVQQHRTRMN